MFKTIPKAVEYEMSMDGNIRRKDGQVCTLTELNGEPAIELEIYGETRVVTVEWLRLITHFEVDLPKKDFFRILFYNTFKWKYSNRVCKLMVFQGHHPEYKPGYRYIPNLTRYAVSKDGEVIDTYLAEKLHVVKSEKGDYLKVQIYNPDKGYSHQMVLHKLVALAWVPNPDPMLYYMCNHIDGNKQNPYYSNLEWTDHAGNMAHAHSNGLRPETKACKVRNVKTGEVRIYNSVREASDDLGFAPRGIADFAQKKPIHGLFEIKELSDMAPWNSEKTNGCKNKITIRDSSGKETVVYGLMELRKALDIELVGHDVRRVAKRVAQAQGLELIFEDVYESKRIIQVYCKETQSILEFDSVKSIMNALNISNTLVKHGLQRGERYLSQGYAFRYKSSKKWNTNFVECVTKAKYIIATHTDGRTLDCESSRIAERLTGVNRKAIVRNLSGIKLNSNWHFKYR